MGASAIPRAHCARRLTRLRYKAIRTSSDLRAAVSFSSFSIEYMNVWMARFNFMLLRLSFVFLMSVTMKLNSSCRRALSWHRNSCSARWRRHMATFSTDAGNGHLTVGQHGSPPITHASAPRRTA